MLEIKIGNESLDLFPDAALELESENPFLQFNDSIKGDYSLPFEILSSPKNMRLLNYAAIVQQRIENKGVDAYVYHNGIQHSRGKIKIELANININRTNSGKISCYYLTGSSDFFQDSVSKRLRDVPMGGIRTFAGGVFPELIENTEFGIHVLDVMSSPPGAFDYAFFPVQNENWGTDPAYTRVQPRLKLMNEIIKNPVTGLPTFGKGSPIVPFPYLKYVIDRIGEFIGWKIEGTILEDEDFKRICLINFRSINWGKLSQLDFVGIYYYLNSSISFDIKDHLPDMTINEFLIALKNRFGWWYDFDYVAKKVTIRFLKDLLTLDTKDLTKYASPIIAKKVRDNKRVYALKNTFMNGSTGDGVDESKVDYQGPINDYSDLPAPVESLSYQVYKVITENNYYICVETEEDGYIWELLGGNIYDYLPVEFTDEVLTSATTVELVKVNEYIDLTPRVDAKGIWHGLDGETPWGIHLAFFYGMQPNKNGDNIPFASHHVYNSIGDLVGEWSLAYKGQLTDGTEVGIYDLNWKAFFNLLNSKEDIEAVLYLPMHEYMKLKFSDTITVSNVKMFVTKTNTRLPYKKELKVEAIRIL